VSAPLGGDTVTAPPQASNTPPPPIVQPAPQGLATNSVPGAVVAANLSTAEQKAEHGAARSALTLEGPSEAKVGDEFQVSVQLSSEQGITRLRSQLRFDSTALQLISATVGDVVPTAAGGPSVDTKAGGAQLDVVASPDDPVQGSGSLMILRFKALAARPGTNVAAMLNVLGGTGAAVGNSSAPPLRIAIAP
jgi:hypothetical protein